LTYIFFVKRKPVFLFACLRLHYFDVDAIYVKGLLFDYCHVQITKLALALIIIYGYNVLTLHPCISLPSSSHFKYRILHAYLYVYCLTKKLVSASAFKGRYEAKLPGPGTDFN